MPEKETKAGEPPTSGPPADARRGGAEVHSAVEFEPSKGRGMSGRYTEPPRHAGVLDQAEELAGSARDRAEELVGSARHRAEEAIDEVREGAERVGEDLRSRGSDAMDRVQGRWEATGIPQQIDDHPFAALGMAFGLGFLLAGSDDEEERHSRSHRSDDRSRSRRQRWGMGRQLGGALLSGVAAAAAQEARAWVEERTREGGFGEWIDSVLDPERSPGTTSSR